MNTTQASHMTVHGKPGNNCNKELTPFVGFCALYLVAAVLEWLIQFRFSINCFDSQCYSEYLISAFPLILPGSVTVLAFLPMVCSPTLLNNVYFSAKEGEIHKLPNTSTISYLWISRHGFCTLYLAAVSYWTAAHKRKCCNYHNYRFFIS